MDKNPQGKTPFTRSSKIQRSPPEVVNRGNESTYPCQTCSAIDDQPIVCCDGCNLWYHFACVNAPEDVDKYEWLCPRCRTIVPNIVANQNQDLLGQNSTETGTQNESREKLSLEREKQIELDRQLASSLYIEPAPPVIENQTSMVPSQSRKSKSSTSSSRRRSLALQRLEEERKMELEERERRERNNKEYLDKKYSILEQEGSDEDNLSYDDDIYDPYKRDEIRRWAEKVAEASDMDMEVLSQTSRASRFDVVARINKMMKSTPTTGTGNAITSVPSNQIQTEQANGVSQLDQTFTAQEGNIQFSSQSQGLVVATSQPDQQFGSQPINGTETFMQQNQPQSSHQLIHQTDTDVIPGQPQHLVLNNLPVGSQHSRAFGPAVHTSYSNVSTNQHQHMTVNQMSTGNQHSRAFGPAVHTSYSNVSTNQHQHTTVNRASIGNNQAYNQQFVSPFQPIFSIQSTNVSQPVISTSVQRVYFPNPQTLSSYQPPIMSTGISTQSSANGQQSYVNGQPVFMSMPYHTHQPSNVSTSGFNHYTSGAPMDNTNNNDVQNGDITMQNLMSRQVIDKKLPAFSGNPEEWDAWYNRYTSTTSKCNLDNSENLDRLSKCLKGKAYTMVKSKLGQTEAVPWIISTLQKVYGRPETVLKAVMKRIRDIPPIKNDNLQSMMEFAFEVQSVSTTIESSKMLNQYKNPMLLEELVGKLPANVKLDWAKYKRSQGEVTIKTFTEWLDELADAISTVVEPTVDKSDNKKSDKKEASHVNVHLDGGLRKDESSTSNNSSSASNNSPTTSKDAKKVWPCITCGKGCERIERCPTFNSLTVERRLQEVKERKICRICLKKHRFPCKSTNVCGKNGCSAKHHSLLHNESQGVPRPNATLNNVHYDVKGDVMLKYAPVILHKNGVKIKTIAFFDDGSQASMVEQNLVDTLGVKGTKEQLCLLWTDNIHRKEEAQRISIEISGENETDHRYQLNGIRSVRSLHLPAQTFKKEDLLKRYPYLRKIPMGDYENALPGILIGSDFPKLGIQLKTIEGIEFKSPIASKTRLGWCVYGPIGESIQEPYVNNHQVIKICPHHNQMDHEVHQQIKEYFSIENFGVRANSKMEMESKDNLRALDMMKRLTKKVEGRYETGLLWKQDNINKNVPDSYPMAMKRLISLEKQGEKVVNIIGEKIADYVAKGYARKLSNEEINELGDDKWFLPVFGVVHPKKPEKLRMVFDGAAKVKSVSLNSMLLTGPDELASLVDILRRLREKLIAVGGDIKEMYHQVRIQKEDQRYQLFLFRNDPNKKPDIYVMCVMTFGSRCSPAAAQHVKNTNAKEYEKTHPRAVEAIVNNHYVDDMMDGENTVGETIKMTEDVKMIHANGGFELRNFISNSPEVLKAIGSTDRGDSKEIKLDSELKTERVLGMWWNTKLDVFTFSLKFTPIAAEILNETRMPTKRELLRTLMSVFDPLGLLSNYLIQLKILLQDVWRADLKWDDQISSKDLVNRWKQWLAYLPSVENVQVPRLYSLKLISDKPKSLQIHIFVDASVDAFSAVIYLRIEDEEGVDCALMGSKARVAPLQYLSIPRKELQAAVLGTRLMTSISQAQRFKINRRVLWSDSETVLSWLKSDNIASSSHIGWEKY